MHLRKQATGDDLAVRFFTNTFTFENPTDRRLLCRFSKMEPDAGVVRTVFVNDRDTEFQIRDREIDFQFEVQPRQKLFIRVEDHDQMPAERFSPSLQYRLQTRVRRHLSEFRDNYLVRHPNLLKATKLAARLVRSSS